jgi:hypothetical protein
MSMSLSLSMRAGFIAGSGRVVHRSKERYGSERNVLIVLSHCAVRYCIVCEVKTRSCIVVKSTLHSVNYKIIYGPVLSSY